MTTLAMQFPEKVFAAMRIDPEQFVKEMRLAAAVICYEQGKISQEVAANIAGLNRTDFLLALARVVAITPFHHKGYILTNSCKFIIDFR